MPSAKNLIVVMSDEHNPKVAGYAGHSVISTPHLDRVAAAGTRFSAAYTPSPICVPARASFITGQPVHVHRAWDNAIAYGGVPPGWAHLLRDRGHTAVSIGKLHYKGHDGDDYGFTESRLAMHIANGVGDVTHLIRDPDDVRVSGASLLRNAKAGESDYTLYDRQIAADAQVWLREIGAKRHDKPWVLFVSMVSPHFPLTAPPCRNFTLTVPTHSTCCGRCAINMCIMSARRRNCSIWTPTPRKSTISALPIAPPTYATVWKRVCVHWSIRKPQTATPRPIRQR